MCVSVCVAVCAVFVLRSFSLFLYAFSFFFFGLYCFSLYCFCFPLLLLLLSLLFSTKKNPRNFEAKKNIFLWKFSIYYKSFNSSSVYQNNAMVFVIRNDCDDVDTVAQSYEKSVSSTLSFSLDLFAPYFYSIFLKNHHGIPLKWRGRKKIFLSYFDAIQTRLH